MIWHGFLAAVGPTLGIILAALLLAGAAEGNGAAPQPSPEPAALVQPALTPCPTTTPTRTPVAGPAPAPSATPAPTRLPASGPPTRIVAPAIDLDAPVVVSYPKEVLIGDVQGVQWGVPLIEAGFHDGSAYPGQAGNTVISGHHNIGGEVFRYLVDLVEGDEVTLYAGDVPYRYRVTETMILQEFGVSDEQRIENARWIAPTDDERLTLITCWPYSGNSHRVIVVARPIP